MMGVSRPTVREAVLALEVLGVLQVRSGDGTYVVHDGVGGSRLSGPLSQNFPVPAIQVLEARRAVEPAAMTLAAMRTTPEQVDELAALLDEAEKLAERVHDLGPFVQSSLQFHVALARFCGNAHLGNFVEALVDIEQNPMWTLLNAHAMQSSSARAEQIAEHREILAAVRAGDAERAAGLMTDHLGHLALSVEALQLGTHGA
jgi:DNA-binding FadR family transcriptional regulator